MPVPWPAPVSPLATAYAEVLAADHPARLRPWTLQPKERCDPGVGASRKSACSSKECPYPPIPRRDGNGQCRVVTPGSFVQIFNDPLMAALPPAVRQVLLSSNNTVCVPAPRINVAGDVRRAAPPSGELACLYRRTWVPAKLPTSMLYLMLDPYSRLLAPDGGGVLGRPHVRLAVTHQNMDRPLHYTWSSTTKNRHARTNGLWFYYAEGCSDLYYDVGNTRAFRNRVGAAIGLAALAGRGGVTDVAAWLNRSTLAYDAAHAKGTSWEEAGRALSKPRYLRALAGVSLEALLLEAAAGPFVGNGIGHPIWCDRHFMMLAVHQNENMRQGCVGSCARSEVIACLWLFNFIDDYLLQLGLASGLDSIQLLQQPQGGYTFFQEDHYVGSRNQLRGGFRLAVEILDLRTARLRATQLEEAPETTPILRHLSGPDSGPCVPWCAWRCCMACASSVASIAACTMQLELLVDERRVSVERLLPHGNRTVTPIAWCAVAWLPWPAPRWTRGVGVKEGLPRARRGCIHSGAVGTSALLRRDAAKLRSLVELTAAWRLRNAHNRTSSSSRGAVRPREQNASRLRAGHV